MTTATVARPPAGTATAPSLHPAALLPGLRTLEWAHTRGLSDDGFCDSMAYVSLSRELCATLSCHGATVSQRGLGELDMSVHRAWDRAADNLLWAAQTDEGTRILTRPAARLLGADAPGLQLAVPGAPVTAWLAHPHTFTVLDRHLFRLLHEPVFYLAPTPGILLALPASAAGRAEQWARRALKNSAAACSRPVLSRTPLVWRHGFPAVAD